LPATAGQILRLFHADVGGLGILLLGVVAGSFFASAVLLQILAVSLAGLALAVPLTIGIEFLFGTPLLMFVEGFGSVLHVVLTAAGLVAVLCAIFFDYACHAWMQEDDKKPAMVLVGQRSNSDPELLNPPPRPFGIQRSVSFDDILRKLVTTSLSLVREITPPVDDGDDEERIRDDRFTGLFCACLGGMGMSVWPLLASTAEGEGLGEIFGELALQPSAFFSIFAPSACVTGLFLLPLVSRLPMVHSLEPIMFFTAWRCYIWHRHNIFSECWCGPRQRCLNLHCALLAVGGGIVGSFPMG